MRINERTLYLNPEEVEAYGMVSPVEDAPVALKDVAEDAPWCPWRRWQELTEYIQSDERALSDYGSWPKSLAALFCATDADAWSLERHIQQRKVILAIADAVMIHEVEAFLKLPHNL